MNEKLEILITKLSVDEVTYIHELIKEADVISDVDYPALSLDELLHGVLDDVETMTFSFADQPYKELVERLSVVFTTTDISEEIYGLSLDSQSGMLVGHF